MKIDIVLPQKATYSPKRNPASPGVAEQMLPRKIGAPPGAFLFQIRRPLRPSPLNSASPV